MRKDQTQRPNQKWGKLGQKKGIVFGGKNRSDKNNFKKSSGHFKRPQWLDNKARTHETPKLVKKQQQEDHTNR